MKIKREIKNVRTVDGKELERGAKARIKLGEVSLWNTEVVEPVAIAIVNCVLYNDDSEKENEYNNYVVVDSTGELYYTTSEYAYNSLDDIFDLIDDGDLDNLVRVKLVSKKSKNTSGDFYKVELVDDGFLN